MRSRGIVLTALLTGAALLLTGCASAPPPPPASLGSTLDQAVPAGVATLPLVDAQGRTTSLAALHGKVVVLIDSMTLCQETCPMTNANLVAMARDAHAAGHDDIAFVTLTVDPQRDTSARLAAYRTLFAPAPADWLTLTADPATIAAVWRFFGVYYEHTPEGSPPGVDWLTGKPLTYDVAHSDLVFFLDRDGHERFVIDAAPNTRGAAPPKALDTFLNGQGRQNLTQPTPLAWTVPQGLSVVDWLTGTTIPDTAPA